MAESKDFVKEKPTRGTSTKNKALCRKENFKPRVCGLTNPDNTKCYCFMKSVLQCLTHTTPLREYFSKVINCDGLPGKLAEAFAFFLCDMCNGSEEVVQPEYLKEVIHQYAPSISENRQGEAQELLTVLLAGLHDDLNDIKTKSYVRMEVDEMGKSEQEIANEWWGKYELRDKSCIVDMFYLQMKIVVTCPNCHFESKRYELVSQLTLPIPMEKETVTLHDCLNLLTSEKQSQSIDFCDNCNDLGHSIIQEKIFKTPSNVIIYLKRFNANGFMTKVYKKVNFPINDLSFDEFCPDETRTPTKYDLYAVINLNLDSSHYTAYVKCDGNWYECDDTKCTLLSESQIVTSRAYILFYEIVMEYSLCPSRNESLVDVEALTSGHNHVQPKRKIAAKSLPVNIEGDSTPKKPRSKPHVRGLRNFGNTCFINTVLQCLTHTTHLREHLFKVMDNCDNSTRKLAEAFTIFLWEMWNGSECIIEPEYLKKVLLYYAPTISEHRQGDAQELLTFLLTGLHDDLNDIKTKPYVRMEVDEMGKSEQEIANEWWEKYELRDKSCIVDMFYLQMKIVVTCPNCHFKSKRYELVSQLTLPIPMEKENVTLHDCLNLLTSEKQSQSMDFCDNCNDLGHSIKQEKVWKTPSNVIIYFKRFNVNGFMTKICKKVKFPINDLSFDEFCPDETRTPTRYDLYAVINHFGSLYGGHYTAYVKCDGNWYECDDTYCTLLSESRIVTANAYVLFYEIVTEPLCSGALPVNTKDESTQHKHRVNSNICGLYNNDWSMNAILQCLTHTSAVREYFFKCFCNSSCKSKELAQTFAYFLQNMWNSSEATVHTEKLKNVLDCYAPKGFLQGDALKLLTFLLNSLHQEVKKWSNTSPIKDIFYCQLSTSTICPKCHCKYTRKTIGKDYHLTLSVPSKNCNVTLKELFPSEKTYETERNCFKCHELVKVSSKINICNPPPYLIIHLDYNHTTSIHSANNISMVKFPLTNLSLDELCASPQLTPKYDLYAVINKISEDNIHYAAYIKNSGKWYSCDDSKCSELSASKVVTANAYILFYQSKSDY